jgi:thiosulfate dehydrogenase [quinone] large subunit
MTRYRAWVTWLSVLAAVILFYMENPWFSPDEGTGIRIAATIAFWVLALVVVVLMFQDRNQPGAEVVEVEGPAFTRYLFSNTAAGWFWLPIRIFLGFEWLTAGWEKLTGTGWVGADGGSALLGYWQRAVTIPDTGRPAISFEWYRGFLDFLISIHAETWFSWLIVFGEIAVGLGLLVGALTGIAAFFGATMNMSYMLAGSASSNPILFAASIGLILGWRVAGYYGLDRYLLPRLGVPWGSRANATRQAMGGAPTAG